MGIIEDLQHDVLKTLNHNFVDLFTLTSQFINHFHKQHTVYKTYLISFATRIFLSYVSISLTYNPLQSAGNKTLYRPRRFLQSNVSGIDISTCRLWYAMVMSKYGDYRLSLRIINKVLSSISPFALYYTGIDLSYVSEETKSRYVDMFSSNDTRVTERAGRAWMFDLRIMRLHTGVVPAAVQIELKHCDDDQGMFFSPFVCAYYLMFLNYSGLSQYDNRYRALCQLIEVVNDQQQCGRHGHNSCNVAGHCLLSVGEWAQADDMFLRSYMSTLPYPAHHRHNSAQYYLQYLSHIATNS